MNTKRIVKTSLLIVATLALVLVSTAAWFITAGMRPPMQVAEPDYWPTDGWRSNTPEQQGYSSQALADTLQEIQKQDVPLDSLMIVHNGYVVLDAHFAPYDGTFAHNFASVTKSMTTTLIGIAASQGKIDLDKPAVSYFPKRTIANLDERKQRMTVRHLVTMRNGMESGCFEGDDPTIAAMRSQPDWVQAALDRPMAAEPGTEFCYDSPGMHILSAILTEATGMTEGQFAQQYVFGPLGIRDALWDVDPQGYSRGWGDLYLTPESAAKIGMLWLQQGKWDGQQIVPRAWVLDSVRAHSTKVNHDYGYGNGWWINMSHYFAAGRGGQEIRAYPWMNTVVVLTGGGIDDTADVVDLMVPNLLLSAWPRQADPHGQAALQDTLNKLQQAAAIPTGIPTPEIAGAVSGRTYTCAQNPAGLSWLRVDLSNPDYIALNQEALGQEVVWKVGLGGHYRVQPDGGDALVGYWEDAQTFHLEIFDIGTQVYQIRFDGDSLNVISEEAGLTILCKAPGS
jgi:CubicO group peptidase (beta-lactamase class C family)